MSSNLSIAQAQQMVDKWVKTYGVRYFDIMTNMAILTEEVGETAKVIARKYGEQSSKAGENLDLADELSDVLWVLIAIANQTGIDLEESFIRNIEKKTNRDKSRHLENDKLK